MGKTKILLSVVLLGWLSVSATPPDTEPLLRPSSTQAGNRPNDQPLRVGVETDNFPYSYLTTDQHVEGFAVDVLDAAAQATGIRIQRVPGTGSELAGLMHSGRIDAFQLAVPGTGCEDFLDLSATYLEIQSGFFVRKNDRRFASANDLARAEVVFPCEKSPGEKFLTDNGISTRLVHSPSIGQALSELDAGEHDAAYAPLLTTYFLLERRHLANIRLLGEPLHGYSIRLCFGVPRGDAALLNRLNEGLAIVNRNGEFDTIYRKWFGRLEYRAISRELVVTYIASALGLALLACLVALVHQRTLRKRIARQAEQLAASEASLAEAQRSAHLGTWQYDPRTRGLVCSSETLQIIGRNSLQGAPSYFRILTMIPDAERSVVHRMMRGALRDGIPCEVTVPYRPGPNQGLRIIHATARPIRNSAGHIINLFGTVQDITRQRAAEEGLRAREQLLRALYENVPTAMGVVEETGSSFRFISANPGTARLLGLHNTSLVNRILAELPLPTSTVEFWSGWFRQGIEQHEIHKAEQYHEPAKKHYSITLVPLTTEETSDHHLHQLCFLIDDVTERKEIDAEVSQGRRLRAIGELVGGIAHEFNNLLTPIMLKTELLAAEWAGNPRLLDELQTISRAAKRGADLTRRLLTFGRRADIRPEQLLLHAVIKANFDLLRPTIDRRITLIATVPETLPSLFLNSSALHQIILNLLLNARDTLVDKLNQTRDAAWEAHISVDASEAFGSETAFGSFNRPSSPWIKLTIADNGMGMSPEVQERIFEPFYTTKEVGKGTGLGLATVWNLVSRLGGKITVDSTPGVGSAFHVWLPVTGGKNIPKETRPPMPLQAMGTVASILVVEDDELVARTVVALLKRMGHEVTHLANGNDAWQHLEKNPNYDLLLLDLDIPGITGLEIAKRARHANYRGRILIASGRLGDNETRELDAIHVDARLQKPFTPQVLGSAIQACLSGKPV